MPAARQIIFQHTRNDTFPSDLNTTLSAFERATNGTVITARTAVLPRRLHRAATTCPDQDKYNDSENVDSFKRYTLYQHEACRLFQTPVAYLAICGLANETLLSAKRNELLTRLRD